MSVGGDVVRKELQMELAHFKENLAQCRTNIVNQWKTKLLSYKEISRRTNAELQKRQDEMKALYKDKVDGGCTVDDLRGSMQSMKLETDGLLLEKEGLEEKVKTMESRVEKSKMALEEKEKSDGQKVAELQKSMEWCQERLCLQFRKIPGPVYKLQVILTNIDQKEPSSPYVFCVAITNEKQYEVSDCEPRIGDLDTLVQKLNQTNNFRSFIIMMRKRFKESCIRPRK